MTHDIPFGMDPATGIVHNLGSRLATMDLYKEVMKMAQPYIEITIPKETGRGQRFIQKLHPRRLPRKQKKALIKKYGRVPTAYDRINEKLRSSNVDWPEGTVIEQKFKPPFDQILEDLKNWNP